MRCMLDGWKNGLMNKCMYVRMDGWIGKYIDGCMDG